MSKIHFYKVSQTPRCGICKSTLEQLTCSDCGGCGEGYHEGTTCTTCNGMGEIRGEYYCEECDD